MPQKREPYLVRILPRIRPLRSFWLSRTGADKAIKGASKAYAKAKDKAEKVWQEWRPKSVLDILIYICGLLAAIGGLWLGYLGVSGHLKNQQSMGLWVLFGTIIFVLTGAFLHFQKLLWEGSTKTEAVTNAPHAATGQQPVTGRPYVFIKEIGLREPLTAGKNPIIIFTVSNSGSREAYITIKDATGQFEVAPFRDSWEYNPGEQVTFTLAPTAMHVGRIEFPVTLTEEQIKALDDGRARLLFFAWGEYRDEAGQTYPLSFCQLYDKESLYRLTVCPNSIKIVDRVEVPELTITGGGLWEPLSAGKPVRFALTLTNGPLAVTGAFRDITFAVGPAPLTGPLKYQSGGGNAKFSIAANRPQPLTYTSNFIPTQPQVDSLSAGTDLLFIYGRGEYTDSLGRTKPLSFCYVYGKDAPNGLTICSDVRIE
jgi:hypothetical protein